MVSVWIFSGLFLGFLSLAAIRGADMLLQFVPRFRGAAYRQESPEG